MNRVSVITVTYNNAEGLEKTLSSLSQLRHKPYEIVIIDGNSSDNTDQVVQRYTQHLAIIFVSEPDNGIYDAMNKGLARVSGDFIHYLNAGDFVTGEPYTHVCRPYRLPVKLIDSHGKNRGYAGNTVMGYGYCHQGVIFPANHNPYDVRYSIAADFALLLDCFTKVQRVQRTYHGEVSYDTSGVSSRHTWQRDKEMMTILLERKKLFVFCFFTLSVLLKHAVRSTMKVFFTHTNMKIRG